MDITVRNRKRDASTASQVRVKSKVTKVAREDKRKNKPPSQEDGDEELDYEDEINEDNLQTKEKFNFTEGDKVVDFQIHTGQVEDDFQSENEDDKDQTQSSSDESDLEDGELGDKTGSEESEVEEDQPPPRKVIKKSAKRQSLEEKLDQVSASIQMMHQVMVRKGLFDEDVVKSKKKTEKPSKAKSIKKGKHKTTESECQPNNSLSDTTIYQAAVLADNQLNDVENHSIDVDEEVSFKANSKNRASTSSEDD